MLQVHLGAVRAGMRVLGFAGGRHGPPGHGTKLLATYAAFPPASERRTMLPGELDQPARAS